MRKFTKGFEALLLSLLCITTFLLWGGAEVSAASDRDVLYIRNSEDLVAFAEAVNGGEKFEGRLVIQTEDIDLNGVPFTPVGIF